MKSGTTKISKARFSSTNVDQQVIRRKEKNMSGSGDPTLPIFFA